MNSADAVHGMMVQQRGEGSFDHLPPGVVFRPKDELLVRCYLRPRIQGNAKSRMIKELIKDVDIYTTEPWNLPRDFFGYTGEETDIHFFTPRHPTSQNSTRAHRRAGEGFWDGNGKDDLIKEGNEIIGHKTALNFKILKGGEKIKTDWVMHEFRLPEPGKKFANLVLCRIHRKRGSGSSNYMRPREGSAPVIGLVKGEEGAEPDGKHLKRIQFEEKQMPTLKPTPCQERPMEGGEEPPPLISAGDECYREKQPPSIPASDSDDFGDILSLINLDSTAWNNDFLQDAGADGGGV